MKFKGILLKESLLNESVLDFLTIVKTEVWNVSNASSNQPNVWHAIYYEGNAENAPVIAEKLSQSLRQGEWYTNFTADNQVYVVFPQKVFIYEKGDEVARESAKNYGRSIHLDESQLDWDE